MKKIVCCILIFIVTFGLFGCGDGEDSVNYGNIIQTELDKLNFPQTVTGNLNFKESVTVDECTVLFSYNTSNTDVISNTGVVSRMDSDVDVIIVATGSIKGQKVIKKKNFSVTVKKKGLVPEVLDVGDIEDNKSLKAELTSSLSEYNQKVNTSNYLTASTKMVLNRQESQVVLKTIQSPIYVETYTDPSLDRKIVCEEDGKIFSYELKENNYVERKYKCNAEDFSSTNNDTTVDMESMFSYNFDPTKCSYKREGDSYIIQAYFKDALSEEERDTIALMYQEIGITTYQLYNSIMTISYTIADGLIELNYAMTIYIEVVGNTIPIDMVMKFSMDLASFEPYVFDESIHTISPATCIEEIRGFTDILKDGFYYTQYTEYIKVDLEANQYAMSKISSSYRLEIIDEEGNDIPVGLTNSDLYEKGKRTFVIPKDGIYFLKFISYAPIHQTINFSVCDYNTIYDLDNELAFGSTVGLIEGEFDFDVFNYTSEDRKLFKITNTGSASLYLVCSKYIGDTERIYTIEKGKYLYIGIYEGNNRFFTAGIDDVEEYSYSFTCEIVDQSNGLEENFDEYTEITTEESTKIFISGYGQKEKYLKLIAPSRGIYIINYPSGTRIFERQTMKGIISTGSYNSFLLNEGEYVVELSSNNHILDISTISYTYKSVEDKEVDVVIPLKKSDMTLIESEKYIKTQNVKYKFSLENSAILMLDCFISIYTMENEKLTLNIPFVSYYDYIKLEAGNYYFESDATVGSKIYIMITENENVDYLDYSNLAVIPFDQMLDLKYSNGKKYFTFTLEEESNILIKVYNGSAYLLDSDKKCIQYNYNGEYSLKGGTYYIVVNLNEYRDTNIKISIQ